ncbi:uncharacterized protein LOC144885015 isoform X1 [Branchiostoma floridae x Branchiostoma japonicum]
MGVAVVIIVVLAALMPLQQADGQTTPDQGEETTEQGEETDHTPFAESQLRNAEQQDAGEAQERQLPEKPYGDTATLTAQGTSQDAKIAALTANPERLEQGGETVDDALVLSTKEDGEVTKIADIGNEKTLTREGSKPPGSQHEMTRNSSNGSKRTKRAVPAFLAKAVGEIGGKVVSKLGDRIAEGVVENHQEKVVNGIQNYLGKQMDKFDDEYKDLLKDTSGLSAGLNRHVEEADIQLVPKPGATMGNMYAPPGWEIRHKYKYKDDSEDRGSSIGQTAAYTYPAGLGPVLMNGCFGTGYKNGDPCFQAKIPRTGCPNSIDGATYLGVGFDGRGVYSAESRKKSIIQRSCSNLQTYGENEVPDSMTVQGIYDTKVESYTFSSTEEYRQYLAEKSAVTSAKAMFQEEINKASGHGARGGAFGLVFSAGGRKSSQSGTSSQSSGFTAGSSARAQLSEQQTQTFMAMLEMDIFRYEIFMDDVTPDQLNLGFLRDFISLPESYFSPGAEIIFQNFYLRWGTHYIKSAKFGGQLKIIKTKQATKDLSMSEFATRAEADWKMTMSTFSAQASQTKCSSWWHKQESKTESQQSTGQAASGSESQANRNQEERMSSQDYSNEMLVVQGGDQQIAAAITEMYTTALTTELKDWLESIKDYPKPFSFVLRRVTDVLNIPFDSLFPAGEVDYGCLGKTHLKTEKKTGRRYYIQTTTKGSEGSQHELMLNTTGIDDSTSVTVSEIRYCNFADRKDLEESMNKKRMSLERAVTVYLEEGRLLSSDFLLPAGEPGCETAMLAFLQEDNTGVPTWEDMTGGKEFTVVFDMPYDIPGVSMAQDVLELKFFRHMWFSTRRGSMPHLYDGYKNGGSNVIPKKKLSVQGLVMTYEEESGLLTVTDGDYNASKSFLPDLQGWVKGRIVARAAYKKLLNHLSQKSDTVGDVPCNIHWSNAHRFDPTDGGKCIHFTAASEGDIFVVFASIPQNHGTWIYIQISTEGVTLYKALRLQTTQLIDNAGGLGSATLYQSYFVCVTEDVGDTTTVIQYGKTPDNEERPHVWLSFTFHESASLRYYSFGSGESPVKVMGLSLLDRPAKDFIICREGTEMIKGVCQQKCHSECKGCRTSGSNSPTDCIACKHLKLSYPYREWGIGAFECVARCPQHMESKNHTSTCTCMKRMEEARPDGVVECVTECPLTHFDENNICKQCNSICKDVSAEGKRVCSGPASADCDTCKYQRDGRCVEGCKPGQRAFADGLLLVGMSKHQTSRIGLYLLQTNESKQPIYRNNRPVYKHEKRNWFIFFNNETQRWWVGSNINEANGWLYVEDSHFLPEDITGTWKVTPSKRGKGLGKERGWLEDRNVTLQPAKDTPLTCRGCQIGHECKLGDEREDICSAGTASNDDRTMCEPCAAGEFSSTPGSASCETCPAGLSSGSGQTECRVDPCQQNPCLRGICSPDPVNPETFSCSCPSGWTGPTCNTGADCAAYKASGQTTSGVYPLGSLPSGVQAYCDMDTAGGGWTVIQRRQDGSVPFNRTWEEYRLGFGNKSGEYWLGNDNIHLLTNQKEYSLRIELQDWEGNQTSAEYSTFRVSGESGGYRLHISGYSGTAGDSMTYNNGQRFSTVDRDNDAYSGYCSQERGQTGWWFRGCGFSFLNGRYLGNCGSSCPSAEGVVWYHWRGWSYSLKSVSMKIRPA